MKYILFIFALAFFFILAYGEGDSLPFDEKEISERITPLTKGDKGDKGDKGVKGDDGDKGSKGTKGDKGDKGVQGRKGDKGDKGDKGVKGIEGSNGAKGDKGVTGTQGSKGSKGVKGLIGKKGQKGIKGNFKGVKGKGGGKGVKGFSPSAIVLTVASSKREEIESILGKEARKEVVGKKDVEICVVTVNNAAIFTKGENVYIGGAGFFKIAKINGNCLVLLLISRKDDDTGVILQNDVIVPSGAEGERGLPGKTVSRIITLDGDPYGREVDVVLDSSHSVLVGGVVYVEGAGYFAVSNTNKKRDAVAKNVRNSFHFSFLRKSEGDGGRIRNGLKVIPAGPQGKRGRQGQNGQKGATGDKGNSVISKREEGTVLLLEESSTNQLDSVKRGEEEVIDSAMRVYVSLPDGSVSSPLSNRRFSSSSSEMIKVSKSCPQGTLLVSGNCKWNLLTSSEKKRSWCRASDLAETTRKREISIETEEKEFLGKQETVVSAISLKTREGTKKIEMNSESCLVIQTNEANEKELSDCGFFCFFQKLEPLYENDNQFSCVYYPPSLFGLEELSSLVPQARKESLGEKIQSITVGIVCESE